MKIYVISNNNDTLTGLRLGGIDGVLANDKESTLRCIENALNDDNIAVLLITEKLANLVSDKINYIRMNLDKPLVVEIPDRHGSGRKKDFITSYISENIGVNI